jgi:hypothetical protein
MIKSPKNISFTTLIEGNIMINRDVKFNEEET